MSLTNWVIVTESDDTNSIYVRSAGTAAANGRYVYQRALPSPGVWAYTNVANGMYFVSTDGEGDGVLLIRTTTNNFGDGTSLYNGFEPVNTAGNLPWERLTGTLPVPTSHFGTNYTTNTLSQLAISGVPTPAPAIGNAIYVDATNGNDLFWIRGRRDMPMQTLSAANDASVANDVIYVERGQYSGGFTMNPGVSLIGSGRGKTIIGAPGVSGQGIGITGYGPTLKDFTIYGPINMEHISTSTITTNGLLQNLYVQGTQDGLFLTEWESFTVIDCYFTSVWDAFADYQGTVFRSRLNASKPHCIFVGTLGDWKRAS